MTLLPRSPYDRIDLVLAMYAYTDDWAASRAFLRMDRADVIAKIEAIIASRIPKGSQMQQFQECLHGERYQELREKAEQRKVA